MAKIFYVEDDLNLSFVVKDCLQIAGHQIVHYTKGNEAVNGFSQGEFDLCILDVMLPNTDGFSLAKHIRGNDDNIPIIFITARSHKEDKIEGLTIGGDDYITKPFSIEELLLKVNIFLKRRNISSVSNTPTPVKVFHIGNYILDFENLKLCLNNFEQRLTQREAELLRFFIKNPNKLLRREEILSSLWGQDDYFLGRSMDVFISRLRKYLQKDESITIENVPRVGFRMLIKN